MNQWQMMIGRLDLEITCADRVSLLSVLNDAGILLQNVVHCSDLVMRVVISKQDFRKLQVIAEKRGAFVKVIRQKGISRTLGVIVGRPVLLMLFCVLFLLAAYLPSRVFFVFVEGNEAIPTNQILEAAHACGLQFGASRRTVRSEKLKNALLQKIPELQWVGVNTTGCTAVISVREKTESPTVPEPGSQMCSIVALRDGIIQTCTVYRGNSLCAVGQAVKTGQTLVSGYLDCGILTKATGADAEIRALTFHQMEIVSPICVAVRGEPIRQKTNFSLQIGKKLIKLSKDSGNLDTSCGKIYEEKYICLPGGFRLPVAIIKETQVYYTDSEQISAVTDSGDWLEEFAKDYLRQTMVAGEVLSAETESLPNAGFYGLSGRFTCTEMIGQVRYEQTILRNDKND